MITAANSRLQKIAEFVLGRREETLGHGRVGARIARPLLEELGYAPTDSRITKMPEF